MPSPFTLRYGSVNEAFSRTASTGKSFSFCEANYTPESHGLSKCRSHDTTGSDIG